jgi:hypothetical protein
MTQSKQSKQAASKSEYGTLTAKMDANNDYSSGTSGTSATSGTTSANLKELSKLSQQSQTGSTTSATSSAKNSKTNLANQTLTAKYDANGDYSAE